MNDSTSTHVHQYSCMQASLKTLRTGLV